MAEEAEDEALDVEIVEGEAAVEEVVVGVRIGAGRGI